MAIHVTLIAGSASKEQDVMPKESLARSILDSTCTKTVAGKIWTDEYVSMLTNREREEVLKSAKVSSSLYKFGDGKEISSKNEITVPMTICGKKIKLKLQVDVVENDIPQTYNDTDGA